MRKDVPPEVAAAVCERMTDVGLLDDAAYAEVVVRGQRERRGLAASALRQELRRRGVGDDDVSSALGEVDDAAEEESARQVAVRRAPALRALPPEVALRRLVGVLARRGHPMNRSLRVAREALGAVER